MPMKLGDCDLSNIRVMHWLDARTHLLTQLKAALQLPLHFVEPIEIHLDLVQAQELGSSGTVVVRPVALVARADQLAQVQG